MNYFHANMSENEAKTLFRKLAVQLHPDKPTGSHEGFLDLNKQYQNYLNSFCGFSFERATQETDAFETYIKANEFIKTFAGVTVELTGSWVWLTGNTYPFKDTIKENGFLYSKSKQRWYKAPYEVSGKRKGIAFSKIQETYGYQAHTIKDDTMKIA